MGVTALPSGFSGLCYRFIVLQKAGFDKTQPMLYVKLRLRRPYNPLRKSFLVPKIFRECILLLK